MKYVVRVEFSRKEPVGKRFRVYLNLVTGLDEWGLQEQLDASEFAESVDPNIYKREARDWIMFIYAKDELGAAVTASRLLAHVTGIEEQQDAE